MANDVAATNPAISGTSGVIDAGSLMVTSFTPTPTGFVATFNKPLNPANLVLFGLNPDDGCGCYPGWQPRSHPRLAVTRSGQYQRHL